MTNRKKALLGASATIAVWATAFPFSKIALQSVDSLTLSVARVMGGALLMLVIGVVKGLHIPTTWREWGLYILLGATGNFVYQVVYYNGFYWCGYNYSLELNPYNPYRCIVDFARDDTLCSV